jgi:transposase
LPGREGTGGVTAKDNRLCVAAVISRYRASIPWRALPERFGAWKNMARRPRRWSTPGGWQSVCTPLAADTDHAYAMRASTLARAHQQAAGAKGGTRTRRALDGQKAD